MSYREPIRKNKLSSNRTPAPNPLQRRRFKMPKPPQPVVRRSPEEQKAFLQQKLEQTAFVGYNGLNVPVNVPATPPPQPVQKQPANGELDNNSQKPEVPEVETTSEQEEETIEQKEELSSAAASPNQESPDTEVEGEGVTPPEQEEAENGKQQSQIPDLQAQKERASRLSSNWLKIPVNTPGTKQSPIQRKLSQSGSEPQYQPLLGERTNFVLNGLNQFKVQQFSQLEESNREVEGKQQSDDGLLGNQSLPDAGIQSGSAIQPKLIDNKQDNLFQTQEGEGETVQAKKLTHNTPEFSENKGLSLQPSDLEEEVQPLQTKKLTSNVAELAENKVQQLQLMELEEEVQPLQAKKISDPTTEYSQNKAQSLQPTEVIGENGTVTTVKTVVPGETSGEKPSVAETVGDETTSQPLETADSPKTSSEAESDSDQSLMNQELASAAAQPGVKVEKTGGGPAVLTSSETPTETPEPVPSSLPTPTAKPSHPEEVKQEAAGKASPSDTNDVSNGTSEAEAAMQQLAEVDATPTPSENTSSEAAAPTPEEGVQPTAEKGHEPGGAVSEGQVAGAEAGTPPIPSPSPDALRQQIPERELTFEEFQEVFESGQTPEQDQAESQQLLNGLQADVEQHKAVVQNDTQAQKAEIAAQAQAQIAAIQSKIETQISTIRESYGTARSNLMGNAEQQKAALEAQVAQEITQVEADTETRIADIEAQLTQRQNDFSAFIEQESQQPQIIAQQESNRANSELDNAAGQAVQVGEAEASRHPGSEDPAPKQRAAAKEVAAESATDIREKKPGISQDLQSRAAEFSARYPEYGNKINAEIEQVRTSIVPALRESVTKTINNLQQGRDMTLQTIDNRLQVDLKALDVAEAKAIPQIRVAGQTAIGQIQTLSQQTSGEIDAAANALVTTIERTGDQASTVISAEEEPYLPGVVEVVEAARSSLIETSTAGREQLNTSVVAASQQMTEIVTSFDTQASQLTAKAQQSADQVQEQATSAIEQTLQTRSEQAQSIIEQLTTRQQGLIDEALAEIDQAIEQARSEVLGITEQFRTEITPATDKSIEEAKKPLTDPLEDRVEEAAEQADESWFSGLLRAIGDIVVGLVILVVVALVVAAIAAAFGVVLTAWTAIMVAGAILLLVGLGASLYHRFTQEELADASPWEKIGLAVMDTTGITGIIEGVTGEDIVTGQELSAGEQTYRGTTGLFTAVMLIFGARAAIKGPPGGAYIRPTGMPRGWVGWRNALPSAWRGMRSVGVELYTGLRQGVRNMQEWVRERLGRKAPAAPEEPGPGARPQRGEGESQADYMQRLREWRNRQRGQQQYEQSFDERITNAENRIRDPRNQKWWDEATPREKRLAYDMDHQGLIEDQGVNEARLGLLAEREGVVDGPIRRSEVGGEFVDSSNTVWDVKSGRSGPETIADDLVSGRNILIDREGSLSEPQFRNLMQRLANELINRGHADIVPQLPTRVQPVPPFANVPPPVIPDQGERESTSEAVPTQ
ncbi:MAG: pre-toxin TG domain-containing protein [Coleofasciculus sp. D1-CHI-01]|uniref:hypothetical protein n=1 Tax=Coleofasciculus sp. D1-CHI-01 TaxID=3068482 RepID=UPI0033018552